MAPVSGGELIVDVRRSFDEPDEVIEFGGAVEELVTIGGLTVSRAVQPPGWRWSTHFKPLVGGEWCQAHHVGIQLSGRMAIELADGPCSNSGLATCTTSLPATTGRPWATSRA